MKKLNDYKQPQHNFPPELTVDHALQHARQVLNDVSETPALDAQLLLGKILDNSRTWVVAHPQSILSTNNTDQYHELLARRSNGEPLPYILGSWEFFGRRFHVDPSVLIPRPETEQLVEEVLKFINTNHKTYKILELGTGSGCIAISLILEMSNTRVIATDISIKALETAAKNIQKYGVGDRIDLIQMDLFSGLKAQFDVICANLPYIPSKMLEDLQVGQWEPRVALDGGAKGLKILRRCITSIAEQLAPNGSAVLEIEENQGDEIRSIIQTILPEFSVRIRKDLAGFDRIVVFER